MFDFLKNNQDGKEENNEILQIRDHLLSLSLNVKTEDNKLFTSFIFSKNEVEIFEFKYYKNSKIFKDTTFHSFFLGISHSNYRSLYKKEYKADFIIEKINYKMEELELCEA